METFTKEQMIDFATAAALAVCEEYAEGTLHFINMGEVARLVLQEFEKFKEKS